MVVLVGGLLVVRNKTDEGTAIGVVDDVPAATSDRHAAPGFRHGTGPTATSRDTTVVSTVPPTTSAERELTVGDVRAMQADALRALPGFTAAVTKTVFDPVSGEPSEETRR